MSNAIKITNVSLENFVLKSCQIVICYCFQLSSKIQLTYIYPSRPNIYHLGYSGPSRVCSGKKFVCAPF